VKYEEIEDPSRAELAVALSTNDAARISRALIALAFYDPDWQWVQDRCLESLGHADAWTRRTAATCLGHIARIHKSIDRRRVVPALRAAALDPDDRPYIEEAINEIEFHVGAAERDAPSL
jgi:hypothetical protein